MNNILIILIFIVVGVFVFILLREFNCWYLKINKQIELKEKQNILLEKILIQLGGKIQENINDEIKEKNIKENEDYKGYNNQLYDGLSPSEKEQVKKFIDFGIEEGEKLVINKKNRMVNRFDKKEWDDISQNKSIDEWFIIFEK